MDFFFFINSASISALLKTGIEFLLHAKISDIQTQMKELSETQVKERAIAKAVYNRKSSLLVVY